MSLVTVQNPAEEPVSLERVKEHCSIDSPDHDALLQDFIGSARREAEAFTRRRLVTQQVEYRVSALGSGLRLPVAPVQSIDAIDYLAPDGSTQSIAAGGWRLIGGASRPYATPAILSDWPSVLSAPESVTITMTLGYGAAADVPRDLVVAVMLLAANYYAHREGDGSSVGMPPNAEAILKRYVFWV